MPTHTLPALVAAFLTLVVGACGGGGGGGGNGLPPAPPVPPPPNTLSIDIDLTSAEVIGVGATTGTAVATFTVNLDANTISGMVTLSGLTATEVNLSQGFAGEDGAVLMSAASGPAT